MDIDTAPARLRALPSWLLVQAAARASGLAAERTAALGTPKAAFPALAALDEFGPCSQAELGRRLGIDRKDVSALAAELERSGMVKRGPDPVDIRRNQLELTPSGRALLTQLDATFAAVQDELLAALSADDRALLSRLLNAVAGPSGGGDA